MSNFSDSTSFFNDNDNDNDINASTSSPSIFSRLWVALTSINAVTWAIIVLLLAFLGFNVFTYLAKGTQDLSTLFGGILGSTVEVSAIGSKAIVNKTASVLDTGLTAVQDVAAKQTGAPIDQQTPSSPPDNSLQQALNSTKGRQQEKETQEFEADAANSSIQGGGKAGWCYIGEDRGFRSCAQVGVNDTCMSGEIFPSQEICMHPNLRA
jgi:hypothetical protein